MRYILWVEYKDGSIITDESDILPDFLTYADRIFSRRTPFELKNLVNFAVFESANPDPYADDHFDGDVIKNYLKED